MNPRNWDGARVDPAVRARLTRLDPRLLATFSPYSIDPFTGNPIETDGGWGEDGEALSGPVVDPSFYLWRRNDDGWVLVQQYPLKSGGLGHAQVMRLEADVARHNSPAKAWAIVQAAVDKHKAIATKAKQDYLRDKALDNKKMMLDAAGAGDDFFQRGGKGYSYSGQTSRTSGGEKVVMKDDRELGIA